MGVLVLVGTRKGLFLLRGDATRTSWELEGPQLTGWEVFHAIRDPRAGTLYAAANNWVYGATVLRSDDLGRSWERSEQIGLPEESGLKVEKAWHVAPGPDALYLGAAPGVMFRSEDGGKTWEPNRGLLEHPTRERWQPGAGGMCCHSIQFDPSDPRRMYVGISAAGVFRTDDGGETWLPVNNEVAADFLPETYPEVGQCVHKVLLHPARPERLWQQNHCGVYRSDDRGETWERLDGNGLPSGFGFPIALDAEDPDTAFVVPEEGAENRVTAEGRLGVYRTRNAGATWELVSEGLPEPSWTGVLREASSFDSDSVYFGTQGGSVFAIGDGSRWVEAAAYLPPVLSVEAAEWSG